MNTKKNLSLFAKYLLVGLFMMLTIITCAGVWTFITDPFVIGSSILLFISNGFVTRHLIRLVNKWDKNTKE